MTRLKKYIYCTCMFLFSSSLADTNPFPHSLSDIEQSEKIFLTDLKHEIEKKHFQEEKLKKEALQKLREEEQTKAETKARIKAYIKRRAAEYESYEALEAEKRKIALEKLKEESTITAKINISQQNIEIFKGDELLYIWKVSTARHGYRTPRGAFQPIYLTKMHYSRKYENSPMPYSVFFKGGYAMHGTSYVHRLGTPASHGCVRLQTTNAKTFYELVKEYGKENTHIIIED